MPPEESGGRDNDDSHQQMMFELGISPKLAWDGTLSHSVNEIASNFYNTATNNRNESDLSKDVFQASFHPATSSTGNPISDSQQQYTPGQAALEGR